jgi:hypothetical protein
MGASCAGIPSAGSDLGPMIALLIARAFAIIALQAQPEPWAPEYVQPLIAECTPSVTADFVGCQSYDASMGVTDYAGLVRVWNDADTSSTYVLEVR